MAHVPIVFISSTSDDLKDHREQAASAARASGFFPLVMEYFPGGRGRSRADVFEKNGTRGEAIFRHPHFLTYLRYFLYGAAKDRRDWVCYLFGYNPARRVRPTAHAPRTGSMRVIPRRSSSRWRSIAGWNCTRRDQSAIP